jgi:hypothetical protein
MARYLRWFNCVVFVGVLINIFGMALPFIFSPQWFLDLFGLPGGGGSRIWMRQAGLLLFLVSLLYVPGGRDPARYRVNAWFAVVGRMTIGLYWFFLVYVEGYTRSFLNFAFLDCGYASLNAVLLWKVLQGSQATAAVRAPSYEVKSPIVQ